MKKTERKKRNKRLIIAIVIVVILGFVFYNIHDIFLGIRDGVNAL